MAEKKQLISGEARRTLQEDLQKMKDPVSLVLFRGDNENRPFNEYASKLFAELSEISPKIKVSTEDISGKRAKEAGLLHPPAILIAPERYKIRLLGAPAGEEVRAFLLAILMVSTGKTILSEQSINRLNELKVQRRVRVFVSPTCPYCPLQTGLAIAAAVERPDLISAEIVEIYENRELAIQQNALSVPQTFVDDKLVGMGLQAEELFIEEILAGETVKLQHKGDTATGQRDLLIIGAGPAGLTAALYAERSGLKTVVIEKANIGGQVSITPVVENYPGFSSIGGMALMDMMARQAMQYADIHEGEEISSISRSEAGFSVATSRATYEVKSILIASGAESKKLGVEGEAAFQGRGVSYCAACDGYFFKDQKKVLVIGGGNTAATEALYLRNIGADVTIVHRRDSLRAENFLQQELIKYNIPVILNTELRQIKGNQSVTAAVLENTVAKNYSELSVEGIFIAIGYTPSNQIALSLGVELADEGYIKIDSRQRTSISGVYAAGDITGGIKQIVTAVSQGAVAATAIFEDLSNPYWKDLA